MDNPISENKDINVRIKAFDQEIKKLEETLNLQLTPSLDFPIYKELPVEVRLALEVINKHGGRIVVAYKNTLKEETTEVAENAN